LLTAYGRCDAPPRAGGRWSAIPGHDHIPLPTAGSRPPSPVFRISDFGFGISDLPPPARVPGPPVSAPVPVPDQNGAELVWVVGGHDERSGLDTQGESELARSIESAPRGRRPLSRIRHATRRECPAKWPQPGFDHPSADSYFITPAANEKDHQGTARDNEESGNSLGSHRRRPHEGRDAGHDRDDPGRPAHGPDRCLERRCFVVKRQIPISRDSYHVSTFRRSYLTTSRSEAHETA